MPLLSYVGPHDEVVIAATGATCQRGGTVEVDADLAKALLDQDVWKTVTEKKEPRR
mgnify:CR=1 FL=1